MKKIIKKFISIVIISYLIFSISCSNVLAINTYKAEQIESEDNIENNNDKEDTLEETEETENKRWIKIVSNTNVITKGKSITLKLESSEENFEIVWSSSDETIAKVDENGVVTGLKAGKVIIKACMDDCYDEIELTIKNAELNISLSDKKITIYKGKTKQLKIIYSDEEIKENITWFSSNQKIVKVDKSGLVTGINKGSATITAKTESGKKATCTVTVNIVKSKSISLGANHNGKTNTKLYLRRSANVKSKKVCLISKGKKISVKQKGSVWCKVTYTKKKKIYTGYMKKKFITMYVNRNIVAGDTYTLKSKISPSNSTDKITYSSSNRKIAKVDGSGKITGISPGMVTITAKTESGKTDYITIRIIKRIKVERIIINTSKYIKLGTKVTISKAVYPTNTNDTFTWKSSNNNIATINSSGVVTPISIGKVIITVKAKSGKSANCTVYITNKSVLSLNCKAGYIADQYENVQRIEYGKSCLGNPLEAYEIIGNGTPTKTIFIDCAVHGYEDEYAKDGKVLVSLGNALVEYYAKNPSRLKDYKMVVVPCANPDGTISGKNNYRAEIKGAFGRCTYKGKDMNRDFKKGKFQALESRALRDLMLKYKDNMKLYFNMHGWENSVIGDKDIVNAFRSKVGLSKDKSGKYGEASGYIISYVKNTIKAKAALVEYKNSKSVNYSKTENAINYLIEKF